MIIRDFSGGLNTRISPSLLANNQAQVYTNIDNSSGSLKSLLGPVSTGITLGIYFTWYYAGNTWVSKTVDSDFVEYASKLYISNGGVLEELNGVVSKPLGIDGPTNKLTSTLVTIDGSIASDSTTGNLISGVYNYKVKFATIAGGYIINDYTYTLSYTDINKSIKLTVSYVDPAYVVNGSAIQIYREYQGYYYLVATISYVANVSFIESVYNISTNAKYDGKTNIIGYEYVYTYYNSTTGVESIPSLPSNYASNIGTVISGFIPSIETANSIDIVRVYRLGGDITSYTLLKELAYTGSIITGFVDTQEDLTIAGNHILDSISNNKPLSGLKYITEAYAMLFAAIGTKVYFSSIGKPYAWPTVNFINFDNTVTGIGVTANGILVFTAYKTFIITGNSPETFSKYLLSGSQGCTSHKTIQFVDNKLLWLSSDGICMSNGGIVTVPSIPIVGQLTFTTVYSAAVLNNVYYISYTNASGNFIMAFDFRYNLIIRLITTLGTYIIAKKGNLYQVYNGTLQTLLTGTPIPFIYRSPILTEGNYANYKTYKDIYVKYNGTFNIKTYLDSKLVAEVNLTGNDCYNIKTIALSKGYGLEFLIIGTGEVSEINYTALGRQNA